MPTTSEKLAFSHTISTLRFLCDALLPDAGGGDLSIGRKLGLMLDHAGTNELVRR